MDNKFYEKLTVYFSIFLVLGLTFWALVYPFFNDFFEKKEEIQSEVIVPGEEVIVPDPDIDKSFFDKLEELKDNKVDFDENIKGKENPFK